MPKKKPLQPPQHPNGAWPAGLALNNAGFNELAAFLGCSNWFAGELVRHGELKVVRMGSRDVVRQTDAQRWLDRYVESDEYQQRLKEWLEKHPGEKIEMPRFTVATEEEILKATELARRMKKEGITDDGIKKLHELLHVRIIDVRDI